MSARNKIANKELRRAERSNPPSYRTTTPKHPAVKVAVKLTKLPLQTLHRRLQQTARRAATARYILASLSPGSMFATQLKPHQTYQISLLRQIRAEITSRIPNKSKS